MSANAYRYATRPERNVELRDQIVALAQRHKRYGAGMIHLKLRQAGMLVNYERVEPLCQGARLQMRVANRRRCCQANANHWLARPRPTRADRWSSYPTGLNEHWFPGLLHARAEIERWRREYNEERPKKALGWADARRLRETVKVTVGLKAGALARNA